MTTHKKFVTTFFCILWVGCMSFVNGQQDLPAEVLAYADTVLYNGKVLTADDKFTIAQAAAIRDGKFLAVGDSARILKMAGPKTEKIDLQGKTVVPGFIEVHSGNYEGWHGPSGPAYFPDVRLKFNSLDAGLRAMKEVVDSSKAKPGEWIFFSFFRTEAAYQVTGKMLDAIAPNNPVLASYDNTAGVVNTLGLKTLPKWPELEPSIFKDAKGEPTGTIKNWAYGVLTYEVLPWPEGKLWDDMLQSQLRMMHRLNEIGVTTMGGRAGGLSVTLCKVLYDRGVLPVRLRIISEVPRVNPNAEGMLKRMGNLQGIGDEWFKIVGATVSSIDSNMDNGGYMTRNPKLKMYPGDAFGAYGQNKWIDGVDKGSDWKQYSDYKSALVAHKYGWSVSDMHIQGDGGVDLMIETMKAAEKADNPVTGQRTGLERSVAGQRWGFVHGMMRAPDQLKELAKADAQLSFSPDYLFLSKDGEYGTFQYGADAVNRMSPIRTAIDSGLKPILEARGGLPSFYRSFDRTIDLTKGERPAEDRTAANVTGPDEDDEFASLNSTYFIKLEKFITRKNDSTGKIWGAQEKASRQELLWMITNWASRMYKAEKEIGTIEPGKLADLLILGADYMTVPEEKIHEIPILKVLVGGKVKYEKR
ncbi:MAG: amidohydrolase family protein [Acidobacteria bacterium]|nr:amidohydrolase family protein [Acidobacteriota bacterium]